MSNHNLMTFFVAACLTFSNPLLAADNRPRLREELLGTRVTLFLQVGNKIPAGIVVAVNESPIGCINSVTIRYPDHQRQKSATRTFDAREIKLLKFDEAELEYDRELNALVDNAKAEPRREEDSKESAALATLGALSATGSALKDIKESAAHPEESSSREEPLKAVIKAAAASQENARTEVGFTFKGREAATLTRSSGVQVIGQLLELDSSKVRFLVSDTGKLLELQPKDVRTVQVIDAKYTYDPARMAFQTASGIPLSPPNRSRSSDFRKGESSTHPGLAVVIPRNMDDGTCLLVYESLYGHLSSDIILVEDNCEIHLDDKLVNPSDIKLPVVGSVYFPRDLSGGVNKAARMELRSTRFDPLTIDEHKASLPHVQKKRDSENELPTTSVKIRDYGDMRRERRVLSNFEIYLRRGTKPLGDHANEEFILRPANQVHGTLIGATEEQLVLADTVQTQDLYGYDKITHKSYTVPVNRVFELLVETNGKSTEGYYYNPVSHIFESSLHRDAYLLGSAPDEELEECKAICEHYKKEWATISGAERVWAYRVLQYRKAQEARFEEDIRDTKVFLAIGGIMWGASMAPSIPAIVSSATSPDKEKTRTSVRDSTAENPKSVNPEIIVTGRIKGVPKGTEVFYETFFLPPLPSNTSVFTKDDMGTFEIRLKEPGSLQIFVKGKLRFDRNVTKSIDVGDQ